MTLIPAIAPDFDPRREQLPVELPMAYQRSECDPDDVDPVEGPAGADVGKGARR